MKLADTEARDAEIAESKRKEDYSYLREKVSFVLEMYKDQKKSLEFKKNRMKREAVQMLVIIAVWILFTVLLFFMSNLFIVLLFPAILSLLLGIILFPLFAASAIRRNVEYALMMEKLHLVRLKMEDSFIDEERFLNNKIALCEEALQRLTDTHTPTGDDIMELEKLSIPEEYHARLQKYEFHLWPLFVLLIVWIAMMFFVWG